MAGLTAMISVPDAATAAAARAIDLVIEAVVLGLITLIRIVSPLGDHGATPSAAARLAPGMAARVRARHQCLLTGVCANWRQKCLSPRHSAGLAAQLGEDGNAACPLRPHFGAAAG